eukprot:gnl/MRDRNA2_/MRDRNA2_27168_c0_seq1.p1 gnl/MRDRNA2_/MRDRNA2_27168_c0~~gnl/MRDRNA2_/MRDRNA2_27168_c0_seq1.p1  ORF type:complete len:1601 (-),score=340.16 gnl/MRDRNA2_/MRDRNA2_27168_c0_seq1:335-4735(-)
MSALSQIVSEHLPDDPVRHSKSSDVIQELKTLISKVIDIDIVIAHWHESQVTTIKNWANDDVLFVTLNGTHGTAVDQVAASFNQKGLLVSAKHNQIDLKCEAEGGVAEHAGVSTLLAQYYDEYEAKQKKVYGYLQTEARFTKIADATSASCAGQGIARINDAHRVRVCGCRVAECETGRLVADAMQWYTGADVALINGGAFRSSLPAGAVTFGDILIALPFMNQLVMVQVPGSVIRAALEHGLSKLSNNDAHLRPKGGFLQVSSTIRFTWYFEMDVPKVGNIEIRKGLKHLGEFEQLNELRKYSLAINRYMHTGGDGFDMFSVFRATPSGVVTAEAVAAFLAESAPVGSALNVTSLSMARITQRESTVHLQLGGMCDLAQQRESCDALKFTVALINNKTDGMFDDVLPYAVISIGETIDVGCVEGRALPGFLELKNMMPKLTAIIGPQCSDDVKEVAHMNERSKSTENTVFISPISTAVSLRDVKTYPYLARLATPEIHVGKAAKTLCETYNWKRVAVLHDSSLWGTESANAFKLYHLEDPQAVILNDGEVSLIDAFKEGRSKAEDILKKLEMVQAKIVYTALQPFTMGGIFEASFSTGMLHGAGFAWMIAWVEDTMFLRDDGSSNPYAVLGAAGTLGIIDFVDPDTPLHKSFLSHWSEVASTEACSGEMFNRPYCDFDGNLSTLSGYAAFTADSVLMYALAMDKIYLDKPTDEHALYESILTLEPFDGVSGENVLLDSSGDRLGKKRVVNLQMIERRRLAPARTLTIDTLQTKATWAPVGMYDPLAVPEMSFNPSIPVIFPGGSLTAPSDQADVLKDESSDDMNFSIGFAVGAAVGFAASVLIAFFVLKWSMAKLKRQWIKRQEIVRARRRREDLIERAPGFFKDSNKRLSTQKLMMVFLKKTFSEKLQQNRDLAPVLPINGGDAPVEIPNIANSDAAENEDMEEAKKNSVPPEPPEPPEPHAEEKAIDQYIPYTSKRLGCAGIWADELVAPENLVMLHEALEDKTMVPNFLQTCVTWLLKYLEMGVAHFDLESLESLGDSRQLQAFSEAYKGHLKVIHTDPQYQKMVKKAAQLKTMEIKKYKYSKEIEDQETWMQEGGQQLLNVYTAAVKSLAKLNEFGEELVPAAESQSLRHSLSTRSGSMKKNRSKNFAVRKFTKAFNDFSGKVHDKFSDVSDKVHHKVHNVSAEVHICSEKATHAAALKIQKVYRGHFLRTVRHKVMLAISKGHTATAVDEEDELGIEFNAAPIKGLRRLMEKFVLRDGEVIWDCARAMFLCKSCKGIIKVLEFLIDKADKGAIQITAVNDRFSKPTSGGWSDIVVYFYMNDEDCKGLVVEVQLVHIQLYIVREDFGAHEAYEKDRFPAEFGLYCRKKQTLTKGLAAAKSRWSKAAKLVTASGGLPDSLRVSLHEKLMQNIEEVHLQDGLTAANRFRHLGDRHEMKCEQAQSPKKLIDETYEIPASLSLGA